MITKKAKVEQFDELKADHDAMALVLYDILNGKFSTPVKVNCREYDELSVEGSYLEMSVSRRTMPLYLINWVTPSKVGHSSMFMTDDQIQAMKQCDYMTGHQRMIAHAHYLLNRQSR